MREFEFVDYQVVDRVAGIAMNRPPGNAINETLARNGVIFNLGLNHALYGKYFKRQGNRTKAQEQFGKAVEVLRECGADGWMEKYEKELAALT